MMLSATAARCGQPVVQHRPRGGALAASGRRAVKVQALFNFLAPPKAKAGPGKAQELVDQLLELAQRTEGGVNASPATRQQIAELAEELEGFCPRNPLRSPLLYGDYDVLYSSKPQAAGGPYRSGLGRTVFAGQRLRQSLQEPNILVNEVSYRALGLVPGAARQEGEFSPINSNTFELYFNGPKADGGAKGGPPDRVIQVLYLDDRVRIARSVPREEGAEPALFVFKRLVEESAEEEQAPPTRGLGTRKIKAARAEQEQQQEEAPAGRRRSLLGTQLLGKREGLATIAERRYAQAQGGSRGTGSVGRGGTGTTGRGAGTGSTATARKSREEIAAERAAAREAAEAERRAAREEAAAKKAAAEEERRQRQAQIEVERRRATELREAARKQLAELQSEAGEAADKAKAAAGALKEGEKSAGALLKEAAQARSLIDQAAQAVAAALQELEGLRQQEKEASDAVAEARNSLRGLETAGRRR